MSTPEILFTTLNLTIMVMYPTVSFRWTKLRLLLSSVRKERPMHLNLSTCRSTCIAPLWHSCLVFQRESVYYLQRGPAPCVQRRALVQPGAERPATFLDDLTTKLEDHMLQCCRCHVASVETQLSSRWSTSSLGRRLDKLLVPRGLLLGCF